ncbi:putative phosphoesterase (metalloenzyme) [Desulfamplus magnetovallimortis]|uniref:Phosphoesterase n=1 Tax=Desulfamplus magnetovallimortis TaxID=1246637 RepID=L0R426_9BACT|nr:YfcE family phosphodiesterase [Desulfamplus magnetovallimortis]CCO06634.1 putative phosphoesterase (metalloenzyme) [Desulfamplus magnetovallimortis BW-1]SLM32685.1 putative phosphoesterase (metalloenzyme) [Desulfamplus magnetovallimortis]
MSKIVITADIHGSYSNWLAIKNILSPGDTLVVAGDLFSTRYPCHGSSDYQPEMILKEVSNNFPYPFFYVYGNCDKSSFSPGYLDSMIFECMGYKILLHHGHQRLNELPFQSGIVVQGHTHVYALDKKKEITFINPGSLSAPRNGFYTYALIENNEAKIINIKAGEVIKSLMLNFS